MKPFLAIVLVLWSITLKAQVSFPDPNVENAVRQALRKFSGPISTEDMAGLKFLTDPSPPDASTAFHDLTGLETARNLEQLHIGSKRLTNYAAIAALTNLYYLGLSHSSVSNLSFLSSLTRLESFSSAHCNISDASPLNRCPLLRYCDISYSSVTNIHALTNAGLATLNIAGIPVTNLTFISHLPSLGVLDISLPSITDISQLTNSQLRNLTVRSAAVTNWYVLTNLPLVGFGIDSPLAPVGQLSFISQWSLAGLTLRGVDPVDCDALSNQTSLGILTIENSLVPDFGPIRQLTNLTRLYLPNTGLRDVTWLDNLERLLTLDISQNAITNWSALAAPIHTLKADSTGLSDLAFVSGLRELRFLHVSSNSLVHIGPLSLTTNLSYLDLSHNAVSSLLPLVGLPQLRNVNADYNHIDLTTGSPSRASLNQLRTKAYVNFRVQRYRPRLTVEATAASGNVETILRWDDCPGVPYVIERTADFVDWEELGSFYSDFGMDEYREPIAVAMPPQPSGIYFYRVRCSY